MGVWLGPIGGTFNGEGDFTFTGRYDFASDGNGNWEIALYESGTLKFTKKPGALDIAVVAGGLPGGIGENDIGGVGGKGGGVVTFNNVETVSTGVDYNIVVGESGANSEIVGLTINGERCRAVTGAGSNGGLPSNRRNVAPTRGDPGTKIWNGVSLIAALVDILYGAGGGPGGFFSVDYANYDSEEGGETGGGEGGYFTQGGTYRTDNINGQANTGAGGGAGGTDARGGNIIKRDVGLGGSGIVRIRNHRG
jgi:hypothetical protein